MTPLNVLKSSKKLVKKLLVALRRSYVETFHAFDAVALEEALRKLGVAQGQAVLVHSSFSAFEGFSGKPSDIVEALENVVGSGGAILMLT